MISLRYLKSAFFSLRFPASATVWCLRRVSGQNTSPQPAPQCSKNQWSSRWTSPTPKARLPPRRTASTLSLSHCSQVTMPTVRSPFWCHKLAGSQWERRGMCVWVMERLVDDVELCLSQWWENFFFSLIPLAIPSSITLPLSYEDAENRPTARGGNGKN